MYDFEATDEEELPVQEGEHIAALKDLGESLFVRNSNGDEGDVETGDVELDPFKKQVNHLQFYIFYNPGDLLAARRRGIYCFSPQLFSVLHKLISRFVLATQ